MDRFLKIDIPTRAAALAFHTLLSIVPVLGLAFWYLSFMGIAQSWQAQAEEFVFSHLDVTDSSNVLEQFEKLTGQIDGRSVGLVGLAVLIYTAYNVVTKFGDTLDDILNSAQLSPSFEAKYWVTLARRGLLMLLLPIALVVTLVTADWLRNDSLLRHLFDIPAVGNYLSGWVPWAVDLLTLAVIYHFVPSRRVPWGEAMRAALVASPAFILAKAGIGIYNRHALSTQKIYGALAAIPLLIAWVQLAWLIILCGALFIRVAPRTRGEK